MEYNVSTRAMIKISLSTFRMALRSIVIYRLRYAALIRLTFRHIDPNFRVPEYKGLSHMTKQVSNHVQTYRNTPRLRVQGLSRWTKQ